MPDGTIKVNWSLTPKRGSPMLRLEWSEAGGPPIAGPPKEKGFGSRIIETFVASSVSGTSTVDYRPDGLHWQLEFALPTER